MAKPDPALLSPARYAFTAEIMTRYADLDTNGHINNVATAIYFEDLRVRFEHGLGVGDLGDASPTQVVVASIQIEYLAEAFYPDPVVGHGAVSRIGSSSWDIVTLLTQKDVPYAFCKATLVSTAEGRPHRLAPALQAALERHTLRD